MIMTKTEEKIQRIISISKMNKIYAPMVEAYEKGEMGELDLILSYNAVYSNNRRAGFKTLQQAHEEIKNKQTNKDRETKEIS